MPQWALRAWWTMASVETLLGRMSDWLDKSNPNVKTITVSVTRAVAMQAGARPKERGGPLFFRGRQVIYREKKRGE
jgi:hypothetical protein